MKVKTGVVIVEAARAIAEACDFRKRSCFSFAASMHGRAPY
jgi:hypothetical protein